MSATDSSPPVHAQALEGAAEGTETPNATAGRTDDLRAEIAEALNASLWGVCATWRPSLANRAAADLVAAGFRRVPEDAETVRRIANAVAEGDGWTVTWPAEGEEPEELHVRYTAIAVCALEAIRGVSVSGGGEQP